MRRRSFLALGACTIGASLTPASAAQSRAEAFLNQECARAAAEGKGVMLIFFASWCQWCRLMDRSLQEPAAADLIGARFRIVHVRALERRPEMRTQQFEGAEALFQRLGGGRPMGLPLFFFLNGGGEVIASSVATGANIGFPVTPSELDAFDAMIRRTIPTSSPAERAALRAAFASNAPR
jgi:thiol:disulfide interchange protein